MHKLEKMNLRYLPKNLTRKDRKKQLKMILQSRRLYRNKKYFTRKPVKSFHSKTSKHIKNAMKIYNLPKIGATKELSAASGCSIQALNKILNKGEGAYYSSGSRPNQTPQSWGIARLASSLTSGKAAAVDYDILENGCKKNSKALKLAKKAKKIFGYGTRRAPKTTVSL